SGEPELTPERLMRRIVRLLRHGAAAHRRARRLRRYAHATLYFRATPGEDYAFVSMRHGELAAGGRIARIEPDLTPPPRSEEAIAYDVATYDRLRIIETEVMRLTGLEAEIRLDLGAGAQPA